MGDAWIGSTWNVGVVLVWFGFTYDGLMMV